MSARTECYKGLFVVLTGQQFPVAQWFGMVACEADIRGSILSAAICFSIFLQRT